jgi:CubicO group peptidase (beta-lactamase class C family)
MTSILVALIVAGQTPAAPAAPSALTTRVREVVQSAIDQGTIPGAVVYVAQAGRPLFFEALGAADRDRKLTRDALFRIASMTKPITSAAVMMLVEDGRIRLDDPLSVYLPEFASLQVVDPQSGKLAPTNRAVTIRDLLTHTSGIAYGLNPPEALRNAFAAVRLADGLNPDDPTLEANMKRLATLPLAHQPGTAWLYGMNTDVLGRVIEVASGMPLDRFFRERILVPLRMNDTSFRVGPEQADRLARLYTPGDGKRVKPLAEDPASFGIVTISPRRPATAMRYLSGGAGLVSTASDYARFLQMLLNEGTLDGVRLLRPETVRQMTQNQIGKLNCAYAIHGDKFGLGFGVTERPGGAVSVGSYSWGGMYHTFFWVDPKQKLVAVLMTQLYPWGASTLWEDFQKAVTGAGAVGLRP